MSIPQPPPHIDSDTSPWSVSSSLRPRPADSAPRLEHREQVLEAGERPDLDHRDLACALLAAQKDVDRGSLGRHRFLLLSGWLRWYCMLGWRDIYRKVDQGGRDSMDTPVPFHEGRAAGSDARRGPRVTTPLLITQRLRRVDLRGPAGGQVGGQERGGVSGHDHEHQRAPRHPVFQAREALADVVYERAGEPEP